jgi:hypothetical protein
MCKFLADLKFELTNHYFENSTNARILWRRICANNHSEVPVLLSLSQVASCYCFLFLLFCCLIFCSFDQIAEAMFQKDFPKTHAAIARTQRSIGGKIYRQFLFYLKYFSDSKLLPWLKCLSGCAQIFLQHQTFNLLHLIIRLCR